MVDLASWLMALILTGKSTLSFKKEQKVCLLICPELTIFISYICEVDDENKNVKFD